MATTESSRHDARLQALFRRRVVPSAERVRARLAQLFPLAPDAACETYFREARRRRMGRADFLQASGLTPDTLDAKLRAMWESRGLAELAELAPEFAQLARELAAEVPAEGEEISPFVYVMY